MLASATNRAETKQHVVFLRECFALENSHWHTLNHMHIVRHAVLVHVHGIMIKPNALYCKKRRWLKLAFFEQAPVTLVRFYNEDCKEESCLSLHRAQVRRDTSVERETGMNMFRIA